jgi:hypothetical protein
MTATLTDAIEQAKQREQIARWDAGEARLKLDISRPALAKAVLERLDIFGKWAASKSVRKCPAKPHVVAAFCIEQHQMGATAQVILSLLAAIEALHDFHGLSNPVRVAVVRAVLEQIVKIEPPRSWPKEDKVLFAQLDPGIRRIIAEREIERDRELRRLQNKAAAERRQANGAATKPIQTNGKGTMNHDSQAQ